MKTKQTNVFSGPVNQDVDPSFLPEGHILDATDLIPGLDGSLMARRTIRGTSIIHPVASNRKCVGSVEDRNSSRAYFFMWAQNAANNQILELSYFGTPTQATSVRVVAQGAALAFRQDTVIQAEVIDSKYLYWADGRVIQKQHVGSPPRKLNIERAIISGKARSYRIYAGVNGQGQFANGRTYVFTVTDSTTNAVIFTTTVTANGTYQGDVEAGLNVFGGVLNNPPFNTVLSAQVTPCYIEVQMAIANRSLTVTNAQGELILVNWNHLPATLDTQHIDLLRVPPPFAPIARYESSLLTSVNNVAEGCFQFRYRYKYFDNEYSTWSPISLVASNYNEVGELITTLNSIRLSFNDPRLTSAAWLNQIVGIDIAVRDGNDSPFYLVESVDACNIGIPPTYTFLNNKALTVVPSDEPSIGSSQTQVLKLFDYVPLKASSIEATSGDDGATRLYLGGLTEGYDCPTDLNMKVNVDAQENPDATTVNIIGTVNIQNYTGAEYENADPEFANYTLNGFVVYLAGTSYYGISNNPADGSGDGRFEIKNVPKGLYVLRVASYQVQPDNSLGPRLNLNNGIEWQKTSAPVIDCAGQTDSRECFIDLTGVSGEINLNTAPGFGPIVIQNAHHRTDQLTIPPGGSPTSSKIKMIEVYALDTRGQDATNLQNRIGATGMERMKITWDDDYETAYKTEKTDHNGYAWCIYEPGLLASDPTEINALGMDVGQTTKKFYKWVGKTWGDLFADTPGGGVLNNVPAYVNNAVTFTFNPIFNNTDILSTTVFLFQDEIEFSNAASATVSGKIDGITGIPLKGVRVVMRNVGRFAKTDISGNYSIVYYGDNDGFAAQAGVIPGIGTPFVSSPQDGSIVLGLYQPVLPAFSNTPLQNVTQNFTYSLLSIPPNTDKYLKSGALYKFGVVYEDDGNRTCGVVPGPDVYVPFFTEAGVFRRFGATFELRNVPPIWATKYRIVRTKNTTHQRYFQWVTDGVLYSRIANPNVAVPEFTTYGSFDATHIFIRVNAGNNELTDSGLFLFTQGTEQGYTPLSGDRLRFITDDIQQMIGSPGIIEAEIVGRYVNGEDYYIVIEYIEVGSEIKPGWTFEFYTPQPVEQRIYYEAGPEFSIINPGQTTRAHAADKQNQSYGPNLPAIGIVSGGDTYWRPSFLSNTFLEHATRLRGDKMACQDIGRAFIEEDLGQIWRYNRVRFSNLYQSNTKINGLSSFAALDYQDLNRSFGSITALAYSGNILLAICEHKAQSLYVGRGRVLDLRGAESIGRSDTVIQVANESVPEAGCRHPESVVIEQGRIMWWDAYRGRIWRYSQAGVEPIDMGISQRLQFLASDRAKIPESNNFVPAGFDRQNGLYIISFLGASYNAGDGIILTTIQETWAFSAAFKTQYGLGWVGRISYGSDIYVSINNEFFSSRDAGIYRHNSPTAQFSTFYNFPFSPTIKFAVNQAPSVVKDWYSISLNTNGPWTAPSISCLSGLDYNVMESRIPASRWENYENARCADFLRDIADTSAEFLSISNIPLRQTTALYRGRPLKGTILIITLQGPILNTVMRSATVSFSPSNSTP